MYDNNKTSLIRRDGKSILEPSEKSLRRRSVFSLKRKKTEKGKKKKKKKRKGNIIYFSLVLHPSSHSTIFLVRIHH